MRRKDRLMIKVLLCVTMFTAFLAGCAKKETGTVNAGPVIYAEKVTADEVKSGDRIVIAGETSGKALAKYARSIGIEASALRKDTINDKPVLTYLADDIQILTAEKTENGLLFKGDNGYLGTFQGKRDTAYQPEILDGCYWTQQENGKLRTTTKKDDGIELVVYLNYLEKSDAFSGYNVKDDGLEPETETYSLYRITDAWDSRDQYTGDYWLKLCHTSDVHGYIAFDDGIDWQLRMARNAYTIDQARNRTGTKRNDTVITLDGGDVFQGSLFSALLGWEPLSAAFDGMEYDAVAIGNHEFDKGLKYVMDPDGTMMDYTRNGELHENRIPYVTCNLYYNGEKVEGLRDYVILDKTAVNDKGEELPVKIGVIGFAEDYSSSVSVEMFTEAGFEIREDYDYAMSLAKKLKEEDGCDAVILLCHGNSGEIADHLKEGCAIDLVLGGHIHKLQHGETSWGLKYASPGNKSDSITTGDFIFTKENGKAVLKTIANVHPAYITDDPDNLYDTQANLETMDRQIYVLGNDYLVLLSNMLGGRIGYITVEALRYEYLPNGGTSSTTCGNWFASIIARGGDAEIGFVNVGGLRQDFNIPEGMDKRYIKAGDIYSMFPFDDPIVVYEITYEELLTALTYTATNAGHGLLGRMIGIDCYFRTESDNDSGEVYAIVRDGEAIYDHGVWKDGWKDKKVKVAMRTYSAASDRVATNGMHNPFTAWLDTEKMITRQIDSTDAAFDVLQKEADENNGHLDIDTQAHLLEIDYVPEAAAQ